MDLTETAFRIEAPHFIAGIAARGGIVVRSAPICNYMISWTVQRMMDYCEKKHWKVDVTQFPVLSVAK